MHPSRPELRSERLLLRPIEAGDADAMQSYRGREDVTRYLLHEPLSPAATRARIAQSLERWGEYPAEWFSLSFAVELLEAAEGDEAGGEAIGDLRVWNLLPDGSAPASEEPSIFWLGYALHPDMQRRGYAREAAALLIGWLFEEHAASEVRAIAWAPNTASIGLLQKLGFRVFLELDAEQEPHPKKLPAVHLRIDAAEWASRAARAAPTPPAAPTESEES
ncbi:GNAT family N-acetyltransferase [Microterricola viridarii]|uniref:Protein N-acetyltransferase, RimJ/RimL family n=1 Tax=Microterricola viridarii TaxID=412690 RepID=A0A1H1PLI9_9MICO|nr:GNAT family N-acetyltransferase [Microterricola viridarii]SDS12131.1 Protein N-acetyltransferase, RimJ/RimL family [Microterricola viridarii]